MQLFTRTGHTHIEKPALTGDVRRSRELPLRVVREVLAIQARDNHSIPLPTLAFVPGRTDSSALLPFAGETSSALTVHPH